MIKIEYDGNAQISGSGDTLLKKMIVMLTIIKASENLNVIFDMADELTDMSKDDADLKSLLDECLIQKETKIHHD